MNVHIPARIETHGPDQIVLNEAVVNEARKWIGTPYRHQGSRRGVGADCLGFVRGVWRELYGHEPEEPGPYSMDWAEKGGGGDRLFEAALKHFLPAEQETYYGHLVLFRWNTLALAKHAGIMVSDRSFIHAYSGVGVVESPLVSAWRKKIAGVFAFPAISTL
jgi:NlpC/P60 family putative phage cell wall peptidase